MNSRHGEPLEILREVPVLHRSCTDDEFRRLYRTYQVVLLKEYGLIDLSKKIPFESTNHDFSSAPMPPKSDTFGLDHLAVLYESHSKAIDKSWGVENGPTGLNHHHMTGKATHSSISNKWYASYVLQHDEAFEQLLEYVPMKEPKVLTDVRAFHTPCIWVFVCHNNYSSPLSGRAEHIDAVQHDGTWHLQVCGTKTWKIRPNEGGDWSVVGHSTTRVPFIVHDSKGSRNHEHSDCPAHLEVTVEAGDVFVINTRLWFHQTHINDTSSARSKVSFSYARDFYFERNNSTSSLEASMTNIEGTYAVKAHEAEDILLVEDPVVATIHYGRCNDNGYIACSSCFKCLCTPLEMAKLISDPQNRQMQLNQVKSEIIARST